VLENEYAIQKWLEEEGVTTNTMLISKEGGYLYSHGSEHATVSKKLEGRHPEPPVTEGDCYLVGSILSRFHLALKSHSLPHPEVEGFLGRKGIEARINRLPATDYVTKVKELLIESNFEYDELPMGIVHGDPYFNNILINDDDVCVLDLQKVSESPLILDIGRSIADICSHMGELDRNKVKKFIKGYENRRTLTSLENHLLSKAIMYGAVATSVSLYEQHSEYTIASILLKIAYAAKDFDI
jgi:homoserine kinase type II